MLGSKYFSYRKFRRKIERDGYQDAVLSAVEMVFRKKISPPVIKYLINKGTIPTVTNTTELVNADNYELNLDPASEKSPNVVDVGSGYVLSSSGFVLNKELSILNEITGASRRFTVSKFNQQFFFNHKKLTESILRSDPTKLELGAKHLGTATPLIPHYNDNYFHWMIETVPKIRYLRRYEMKKNEQLTYIVPNGAPSWLDQSLELLEVPESKIERASSDVYTVDKLVLTSFPFQSASDFEWIRSSILRNSCPDTTDIDIGSNIYISRSNAIGRRVVNESEVMRTLSKYGFERYNLEDLTVEQNAILFSNADFVVGAHGAGLTDIIFCDDAAVIEFFGRKIHDPYERIAETMGLKYKSVMCKPKATDIFVDTDQLEAALESIINQTNN